MRQPFILLTLVLTLLLSASLARAQNAEIIGPDTYPPGVNPLTGLPVANPEALNRRPLLIKISNYPAAVRPQSGLNSADIVWEAIVEGGVTRFSAIFYGEAVPNVGPVRSARLVDIPLANIYHALFVHSGSSQGTRDYLARDPYVSRHNLGGGSCPPLCRHPHDNVAYEHTLFGDTEALYQQFEDYNIDIHASMPTGMAFSETIPFGGVPLEGIIVGYRQTDAEWTYDPYSSWWVRTQDGEPHYDAYSGSQVHASNVLILEADHIDQPVIAEGYWGANNYATQPVLTGSGRIFLLRDGAYHEGQWRRETGVDPLTFYDLAGNTLPFKPGNTFIQLVPRWFNGYALTFKLINPLPATVSTNGILRYGPSPNYTSAQYVSVGDTLTLVGRNGRSDWVQVRLEDSDPLWI